MLKNEYLVAKNGVDTAENEPPEGKLPAKVAGGKPQTVPPDRVAPRQSPRVSFFPTAERADMPERVIQAILPGHITLSEARSRLYQRRFLQLNNHFFSIFRDLQDFLAEFSEFVFKIQNFANFR